MSLSLRVEACGPGLTVQDAGRFGLRRYGVAWAGAADRARHALANALVGNPAGAAALEVTVAGARLAPRGGPVRLACIGADLSVDGGAVPPATAVDVPAGAEVTLSAARPGAYGYLAVSGGLRTACEMGSRSAHLRSGLGGGALDAGATLPCGPAPAAPPLRFAGRLPAADGPIRVVRGPQNDHFDGAAWERLLGAEWRVHPRSDRMGMRLDGPALPHRGGADIVSDAVLPGAVQVPGDGRPLVLMRDCQTTGGYPKIACVIAADLDRLAQSRAGDALRLAEVSQEAALAATRDYLARLRALPAELVVATRPTPTTPDRLHHANLIDGVHDARRADPDA
jgi:biotin-dependent carboxylase-like uncharacterized protein